MGIVLIPPLKSEIETIWKLEPWTDILRKKAVKVIEMDFCYLQACVLQEKKKKSGFLVAFCNIML